MAGTLLASCKMSSPIMSPQNAPSPLAALAAQYWEGRLTADPIEATLLGDRRFDDRMPDQTPDAQERDVARLEALGQRVAALDGDGRALGPVDRVTWAALRGEIESDLAWRRCRLHEWSVDPRDGPQVLFLTLAHMQTAATPAQGRALVARWQKMGRDLDERIANLRRGLAAGKVATRGAVERVLRQLDDLLGKPAAEWVMAEPARTAHPDWPPTDLAAIRQGVIEAVDNVIRPAFARYREVVRGEILPRSRSDEAVGLRNIPDGLECYQRLIKVHTSLSLAPDDIHQIGLDEVARVRAEMSALGTRVLGTADLPTIQQRLRTDAALYFQTRAQVEAKAEQALRRAEAAMPRFFGRLPRTPCTVKRVEPFEEKDTTIAYYRQPAVDGSRSGTYYINTYAPTTRPRYEAEVLAFHESVPGHHIQIALAQEMQDLPEFRKHLGPTAFVEGWALYTERLAVEMGLYSGDLDQMGMLSFDAWRASRLVVDTGLHVKGWSRQQAIRYMLDNTALAQNNIENEVDRYIGWPGQALAYKIGQREILALRAEAERALGTSFSLPGFHDRLLENGAISLPVLRQQVEAWVAERRSAPR
jgi:uncharacterized protein (DUF885 family)